MNAAANPYTSAYYDTITRGSLDSAGVVVPLLLDLHPARSVVDVGCGIGAWASAFAAAGLPTVLGIDGDYVDRDKLLIPRSDFIPADLAAPLNLPSSLPRRFDLAVSLEVAEHLPPASSETFVESLCRLAPVVLFSAAIPYQGGEGHINERWPTFWFDLFRARGYHLIDALRPRIWSDRRVEPWYQQNLLIYASADALAASPALARAHELTAPDALSLIHPRIFGLLLEHHAIKPPGPWPTDASSTTSRIAQPRHGALAR